MQTSIAQVAALTIYGNAFLLRPGAAVGFYPANSTFQHCEYVNFVDLHKDGNNWVEAPFAGDPIAWFEKLRKQGIVTLRMQYGPSGQTQPADRMLVGFVGAADGGCSRPKCRACLIFGRLAGRSATARARIKKYGA